MAFKLNKSKGPISEINVTPFVDVVLVLLVIFMISAPLMFSGINLKLPKTKRVNNLKLTQKQVILSVSPAGDLFLGDIQIQREDLAKNVTSQFQEFKTDVLYIRADYTLEYGKVAKLISLLKTTGISNIALVTEIEKK
jgi:biopolymer transport protein ExbD